MNDLFSRKHRNFEHILNDGINILVRDFFLKTVSCFHAPVLKTSDVLSCNTYIHHLDVCSRFVSRFLHRNLYRLYCFFNVRNHSSCYADGFGFAHSQNFNFSKFIHAPYNGTNFCCSNIKPYNHFY